MERSQTKERIRDQRAFARERHGLFRCGAFAAAQVRRPSIQNIRERYSDDHVPRARIPGRLTSKPLGQFPPAGLSVRPDPHCPAVWPVGHYRPVRCLSASTICRCITACRSDGRRAGLPRATLRGGFHGPLPGFYRFGGLVMTIASLRSSPKATTMREVLASNDVRTLIANQLGVDVKRVTNEAHFTDDLGADWLDRLELMIVIEDRFADVVITDEDVDQLEVIGDLIRHIESVDNEGRGRSIVEAPLQ